LFVLPDEPVNDWSSELPINPSKNGEDFMFFMFFGQTPTLHEPDFPCNNFRFFPTIFLSFTLNTEDFLLVASAAMTSTSLN